MNEEKEIYYKSRDGHRDSGETKGGMYALNPTFGSYYHKIHIVFFISDYTLVCLGFNSPLGI